MCLIGVESMNGYISARALIEHIETKAIADGEGTEEKYTQLTQQYFWSKIPDRLGIDKMFANSHPY